MMRTLIPILAVVALAVGLSLPPGQPRGPAPAVEPAAAGALPVLPPLSAEELASASSTIDRLVDSDLASHGLSANPHLGDHAFVRRASLAIIGRIPTTEEAAALLELCHRNQRDAVIDTLQRHPGRVFHDVAFWADLLRITGRLTDRYSGAPYLEWLKTTLRENRPYDRMVRELVTASGAAGARGNGATGFYLRDAGMPLEHAAITAQTFLGTRVACAQCHDHPFDRWTRRDFFQFAAYTNEVKVDRERRGPDPELRQLVKDARGDPMLRNILRVIGDTLGTTVQVGGDGAITLPADYQYHDAKPGTRLEAHTIFGDSPKVAAVGKGPEALAAWMTDRRNPRFATVIANRLWKRAFGIGLIEPVDNFTDSTVASDPALMDFLTRLMVAVDFDVLRFQGILYRTHAWQRAANTVDPPAEEPYRVTGPLLRRLSAEQLWDSLIALTVSDPESRSGEGADGVHAFYERFHDKPTSEVVAFARQVAAARTRMQEILASLRRTDLSPAERTALREEREKLQAIADPLRAAAPPRKTPFTPALLRAAELPSPAPDGHPLRVFGQSDRMLVDNAATQPTTPQALILLNGVIDRDLLTERSQLYRTVRGASSPEAAIDALFLAILTRLPTAHERTLALAELARDNPGAAKGRAKTTEGLRSMAWVLLNSSEFAVMP